jgi:hypothetical protein
MLKMNNVVYLIYITGYNSLFLFTMVHITKRMISLLKRGECYLKLKATDTILLIKSKRFLNIMFSV